MMKKLLRLATLALLFTGAASAQTTGTITGVVTDGASGKPVVGAVVVATSPAAPGEQTAVTDAKGAFTIANLPAGKYTLQASIEGYKPETRADLVLGENVTLRANLAVSPEAVQMEEVVVTGSRIRRKDLTTAAPVTLMNKEAMQASGKVGIGDFLQTLPEQGNAINTGVNNGGSGATRVSLRSLGSNRTLVLVNGRRMVPGGTGADDSVDLNSIPAAAIERVEVLKDGASAIYGSDAIGGVVNIITKRNWTGTEVSAYKGISGAGDAGLTDVAVTTGTANDKGSIVFSGGFSKQEVAWAGDRDFSKFQYGFDAIDGQYTLGSSRTPGGRISAGGTGNAAFSALQGALGSTGFFIHDSSLTAGNAGVAACLAADPALTLADCQWRKYDGSGIAGAPGSTGDAYNFALKNYLQTPQERLSAYSAGDIRLGGSSRAFFEAFYVNRQSRQQLAEEPLIIGSGGVTDPGGNLVQISQFNQYNPFGKNIATASMRLTGFGPRWHKEDIDTMRLVAGFDGTLPEAFGPLKGWFWDLSMNYGRTYGTFTIGGSLQSSRIAAALGPSKNGVCYGTVDATDPANPVYSNPINGCVPLDMFHGSAAQSIAARDYLAYIGPSTGTNRITSYQANTSGELFQLLSDRAVGLAAGFEYRTAMGDNIGEPLTAKFDSSNGGGANTGGSYNTTEGYLELVIPVVSNKPGVEDLEFSAAARVFHYSTFGTDNTFKVGGRWKPIKDFTLRGTYSTAFRAPSITDLYTGILDDFPGAVDPCGARANPSGTITNAAVAAACVANGGATVVGGVTVPNAGDDTQLKTKTGGNPDLKPETAKIFTAGVVFEPTVLPNFSATLDYYAVKVDKSISTIGTQVILDGCLKNGNTPYCNLIRRNPLDGTIDFVNDTNTNIGSEEVAGLDLALRYNQPTPAFGRFTFTFDGTWLQKHNVTLADGTVIKGKGNYDLGNINSGQGGSNPAFKFNTGVVWGLGSWGAGTTVKYIGGFKECGEGYDYDVGVRSADFEQGVGACYVNGTEFTRRVPSFTTVDAFLSYQLQSFGGRTNMVLGINNAFDAQPPAIYNTFASRTDQYTYDQIGRFVYARLTQSF